MSSSMVFLESAIAQAPVESQTSVSPSPPATVESNSSGHIWMFASIALVALLIGLTIYGKLQLDGMAKKLRFEQFKTRDLQKKLKLALSTIRKMEANPDLVHSREFNLDYLRLRMEEEVFHFAIVNQIKIKVKQMISLALRPNQATQAAIGIASTAGRQVDETFDVKYETESSGKRTMRVLFRIQITLTKLPTQATSTTISQIIDCIETFLSPDNESWQPTIQGRIVSIHWDQKAKPTPLLVLQQSTEGVNVTLRTNRTRMN
ncbi:MULTISPECIES: hypothetical protein [unclassified Coleofasciculus]|uniref:hypothetical protein n=1 Tax=unclassified Coleofasciculus TaxID=2692782 RepID=UPI00187FCC04|nr:MULTISPECIES: hypothetical protein [unclassified Coleofasciculus]MBE9128720.1 hypothetical protein [Coleofasciculus sp. LEGE 07081]MBE9151489.1 hypothetical protein [Coleofasciculus sp. LEGE 07092]